ncbi:unnamed protein product, partial [Ixodes hexagonus]
TTSVHRGSPRRQGLVPEFGRLPDPTRARATSADSIMQAPVTPAQIVLQQPREPPLFRGSPCEDPEDWLEAFERVAQFNRWNNKAKLWNVFFSLEEAARTWLENRKSSFATCDAFKSQFLQAFTTVLRKEGAELLLQVRVQQPNERVIVFVEEMTRLFRRADPSTPEDKKLRYLMKGVKENLFAGLVRNPPTTVADFITEASTMEKTLDTRASQYKSPTQVLATNYTSVSAISPDALRETIREVVREGLQKLLPPVPQAHVSSLTGMIREEVRQALGTSTSPVPLPQPHVATYARGPTRPPSPRREPFTPTLRRPPQTDRPPVVEHLAPRKTDVWRTADRRPLYYHCGEAGHIYRRCPYMQLGLRGFPVDAPRPRLVSGPATSGTIWPRLTADQDVPPDRRRLAHPPHRTVAHTPELTEEGRPAPSGETKVSNLLR